MRVRIVTYNIHKGVGTDGHLGLDRIVEVVRHYEPEVVCLQEVMWSSTAAGHPTQPQALGTALGRPHGSVALNCHRRNGTYGNVTFSRWPIELHENVDLTVRFKKSRAALYTRLRLSDGGALHVFNLHLGLAGYERIWQMRDLVSEVERVAPGTEAVVLAGDMNDWRHRLYPQVLAAHGYRCAIGDDDDPGHATYPSWMPVGALDKVFVKGDVRARNAHPSRLALARTASDHLPIVAEL